MKTEKNQKFFESQKQNVSKKIMILIIAVLMISAVSALTGHIYHQTTQENDVEILVTYFNHADSNAKNLKVKAYMPDFYTQSNGFKVRSRESGRRYLYLETDNPEPGFHPLIIRTMNDEGIREKKHTWIYIE